ncbi:MAG: hypothetical protein KBT87_00195 [Gammaproteobacteria bacterium]|nr:hypothetical protein [Gammaproteobacteria bacterium]MBQ0773073.1 hypothetical protein [Gammaproteobacteria bacterium]
MAKQEMHSKAAQLLDAHIAFTIEQLTGSGFQSVIEEHIDAALADLKKLKLKDAVSAKQVTSTALFYASEMEISPAIPELVGEIARRVYQHPGHDDTRLEDLLEDQYVREFARKISEMRDVRERIVHESIGNPMYSELIGDVLFHGIKNYIGDNPLTKKIPGAQSMMKLGKGLMDKATPNLEAGLQKYVNQNIKSSLRESERFLQKHLDDDALYNMLLDVWNKIKHSKVSVFKNYVSEDDIEDAFVIGFDFWRTLRQGDYYRGVIEAGVLFFFEKYGNSSLNEIMEEMGVDRDMIVRDVMLYVPGVLKALQKKKLLEPVLRRTLSPFYESEAASAILDA